MATIEPAALKALLRYEPDTGKLFWLPRPIGMFSESKQSQRHNWNAWNGKFSGKEAFTALTAGYQSGRLFGRFYYAHRVIWAMQTGEWPAGEIDHKNQVCADNRWSNLRHVSHRDNGRNATLSKANKSGRTGVLKINDRRWVARILTGKDVRHLGSFRTFEAACSAREVAEREMGFAVTHGAPKP